MAKLVFVTEPFFSFPMQPGRVLLTEKAIAARVERLGRAIARYYRGQRPLVLGVMNGALFFLVDLLRASEMDGDVSCVRLASYAGTKSTGKLRGLGVLKVSEIRGRTVLVVDDIFDTGLTLAALTAHLRKLGAAEVRTCVLLEKRRPRDVGIKPDWVGFRIADEFVVGYGLDYNGRYRGLKEIACCK